MTKIIIIATYFGKWPVWFPAFLYSCAKNHTIQWLFFTDCEIPEVHYPNIRFEPATLEQILELASTKLAFRVQKGNYSQVDLQPTYGIVFREYIAGFDFWGHCDIDVVWGDIRRFITDPLLRDYDIVSFRKDFLAGHLTLWRNDPWVNTVFRRIPAHQAILSTPEHHNFDENIISTFLRRQSATGSRRIQVYWPEQAVVWFVGKANAAGWYWENGKIYDKKHREHIYLHFQHLKESIKKIDFQVSDEPNKFAFTRHGIRQKHPSRLRAITASFESNKLRESTNILMHRSLTSLRLLKKALQVKDFDWAQSHMVYGISPHDTQLAPTTGYLYLKRLGLCIRPHEQFVLEAYKCATWLREQSNARFSRNEEDSLLVEVASFRVSLHCAEDIRTLKAILDGGISHLLFSGPSVVVDVGMNTGLTSLFFASQSNTLVVGYEPSEKQYRRAQYNIALNPHLSAKIQTVRSVLGNSTYTTVAMYYPDEGQPVLLADDYGMGPMFEYEEVEIEDAAEILDGVVTDNPDRKIILKIDLPRAEYHIEGISESQIINRLRASKKLDFIHAVMLNVQRQSSDSDPHAITHQLRANGFEVFLLDTCNSHESMLYAVRS